MLCLSFTKIVKGVRKKTSLPKVFFYLHPILFKDSEKLGFCTISLMLYNFFYLILLEFNCCVVALQCGYIIYVVNIKKQPDFMVGLLGDLCGLLLCLEEFAKFFSADLFYIEFYSIFDSVLYLSLCSTVYQLSARFFRLEHLL